MSASTVSCRGRAALTKTPVPGLRLVDELFLMIHPLVLGSGRRLFGPDDEAHRLRLVDSTATATGVLTVTYRPSWRLSSP